MGRSAEARAFAVVHIGKRYGPAWALKDVSLTFNPGSCTALVGENGAGKSTLVRIMAGLTQPTEGQLRIGEADCRFHSPREALAAGIAVIPQELAYAPNFTVAENLVLGTWPTRAGFISHQEIRRRGLALMGSYGFDLDVSRRMSALSLAERQIVEIVKVLARDAVLLLLDEPTASLTSVESQRLLGIVNQLKAAQRAIVYVSHRLDECFTIADAVAVLRNGKLAYSAPREQLRPSDVMSAMLGSARKELRKPAITQQADGGHVLEVLDLRFDGIPRLDGVSFSVRAGEVVAVFGLLGSGAETLARGLGGDVPRLRGACRVNGRLHPPFRNGRAAMTAGIGYVPAERKQDGLVLVRTIKENLTVQLLGSLSRRMLIGERRERQIAEKAMHDFDIRSAGQTQKVMALSGGNQQKVLLASRLIPKPRVLVLHEPTRGVDVGARTQIHQRVVSYAREGAAAVLVTSDIDEAVAIADRLLVMRDGRVVDELVGSRLNAVTATELATSAHAEQSAVAT